jgi:hypothetical protein
MSGYDLQIRARELSVTDVFLDWQKISKNILEKAF